MISQNIKLITTALLLMLMSTVGWGESWFRGGTDEPFLLQPLEIQTDSWATCAAAFDAAALVQRAQGRENVATAFGDQGNGAELSIAMAEVMSFIQKSSDELKGRGNVGKEYAAGFNRAWTVGKLKMENMPAAKSTWIMAQLEVTDKPEEWSNQVAETMDVCLKNQDTQQMYVDLWRKMLSDGMLSLPQ